MNDDIRIDFPLEQLYPIKDHPELSLRLTVGKSQESYWVEADLISNEGQKIIHHFGLRQNIGNFHDAIQSGLYLYESLK